MRKLALSRALLVLLLFATLILASIVEAGSWSPPANLTEGGFYGPSISGDGSKIAFMSRGVGNESEIFVINSDGSGLKQLTDNSDGDMNPSISGDGSKIAFSKDIFSNDAATEIIASEIFVINSDGSGLTQLTSNSEDAFVPSGNPSISGDDSKVAFQRLDRSNWDYEIFVINSDGSGEKQLTDNR
jgi:Tol biopolymer transport system component